MKTKVAVVACTDYTEENVYTSIKRVIELLGGFENFFSKEDSILLKPNLCLPENPSKAITTHPQIVRQIIRLCIEQGAKVTIGDNPVGTVDNQRLDYIWKQTQMCDLEKDFSFKRSYFLNDLRKYERNICGEDVEYYISKEIGDYNCIINIPKYKTHTLMTFTGAVKNMFGIIPGNSKRILHYRLPEQDQFAQLLLDIHKTVNPRLHIMDAVFALEGNGPGTDGVPRNMNCILASTDGIALDIVASKLMNISHEDIPTNRVAVEQGLIDINNIDIVGDDISQLVVSDFKLPSTHVYHRNLVKKLFGLAKTNIKVNSSLCQKCGLCKRNCPAEALYGEDTYFVDLNKCISCMMCHEICPHKAIEVERPAFYRQLTSITSKER